MDTPHVINTRTKHLSWLLETHPVIQAPAAGNSGDQRSSWAWANPMSMAELNDELAIEEERYTRYGGADPRPPEAFAAPMAPEAPNRHFSTVTRATSALLDPEEINWDGPGDKANPQNWSNARKWFITFIVVIMTVNVTFASAAPADTQDFVAASFHSSAEVADLITSLFLLGYVLGPMFWGPGSELFGRRPIFIFAMSIYTLLHLGQALAKNMATMLVIRFLSGFFACSPLVNAGGVIADIWNAEKRGTAVTFFTAGVFIGPLSGPLIAGYILEAGLTWRWVYWVMMMFAGAVTALVIVGLPETYAPVILLTKVKALRKADPHGNRHLFAGHEKQDWSFKGVSERTLLRPFRMLAGEPILILITIYLTVLYGVLYGLLQAFPIIFIEKRGFTIGQNGLTFIAMGIGSTAGSALNLWLSRDMPRLIKEWRGFPPPEKRLPGGMVGSIAFVVGILWLGWTGNYDSVKWYVPALGAILVGMGFALIFISCLSYLVETYLMYSASAFAANTICRSLSAAAFPLFTLQMFNKVPRYQLGNDPPPGGIGLIMAPSPFLFYRYGAIIRQRSKFAPCIDLKIAKMMAEERAAQEMKATKVSLTSGEEGGPAAEKKPQV
ncbi:MFS general substrate transporter [Mycena sanguinolenta]|uniref:MFS general substrate transporter n=1 Tax=Mycena sanguinolenta TaxID=230812 RepID=A0A8H6ZM90_9AGAR|nr:MFS general substrate transporter [Mycena sanguinolenta]